MHEDLRVVVLSNNERVREVLNRRKKDIERSLENFSEKERKDRKIELLAKLITDRDSDRIIESIPAVFRSVYGNSYPIEYMLSVDRIKEHYSQSGDLLVVILKVGDDRYSQNENWEVIGTGSIIFGERNVKRRAVELGRAAVDPDQQGMGYGKLLVYTRIKLLEVLYNEKLLPDASLLYSEPRAYNGSTQSNIYKVGKLLPFGMIPKYIIGKKREWVLLCYAPFPSGGKLFLPDLKKYEREIPKEIADFWYYLSGEKSSDGSKPLLPYVVESIIEEEGDLYIKGIHGDDDKENNVIFANVGGDKFLKLGRVKVESPHYVSLLIDITRVRNASDAISELLDEFLEVSETLQQAVTESKEGFKPVLILEVAGRRFEPRLLEIAREKGFGFAGFIPSPESSGKFSIIFVNVPEEEKKKLTPVIKELYPADVWYYLSYIYENVTGQKP